MGMRVCTRRGWFAARLFRAFVPPLHRRGERMRPIQLTQHRVGSTAACVLWIRSGYALSRLETPRSRSLTGGATRSRIYSWQKSSPEFQSVLWRWWRSTRPYGDVVSGPRCRLGSALVGAALYPIIPVQMVQISPMLALEAWCWVQMPLVYRNRFKVHRQAHPL